MTAKENREESQGNGGGSNITITGNTFNVREDNDIKQIAYELAQLIEMEAV